MLETKNVSADDLSIKPCAHINNASGPLFTAPESPDSNRAARWLQAQVKRARREGPFTITANLTPELAELLLTVNAENRPLSERKALGYVQDIKAGNWLHNGETIKIAESGELNDGQHRCLAVVEAGRPIVTEMTFGVTRESRSTVDIGMRRSIGQHLGMVGHLDGHHLGHAIQLLIGYERRGVIDKPGPDYRPTTAEILEWADTHDIDRDIRIGHAVGRLFGISVGVVAAVSYLIHQVNEAKADEFFSLLKSGEGLPKGNPILAVRNLLTSRKSSRATYPWSDTAALLIKAWNRWRTRRGSGQLQWRTTGPTPEKFPQPE